MGHRAAGLRELMALIGNDDAGVQTFWRRMAAQLGVLERSGCLRLGEVWSIPADTELDDAQTIALQSMQRRFDDEVPAALEEAQALCDNIDRALAEEAPGPESKTRVHSPSPPKSTEMVTPPSLKGKEKAGERPQKRIKESPKVTGRELKKALEAATAPETPPDYLFVGPKEWEANKRRVGTYRYDHAAWQKEAPKKNPFATYGNRQGALVENASWYVNRPAVVQVTARLTTKGSRRSRSSSQSRRTPPTRRRGRC